LKNAFAKIKINQFISPSGISVSLIKRRHFNIAGISGYVAGCGSSSFVFYFGFPFILMAFVVYCPFKNFTGESR
jgi:hypothetical protein